ncbi:hypothetical protein JCM10207_007538 [Rhodosporidiobolus poonsookiae]
MLPFELFLHVLDYALEATKTPRRLLKRCSLINPTWRAAAQSRLFSRYSRLTTVEGAQAWLECECSEEAVKLQVELKEPDADDEILAKRAVELEGLYVELLCRAERLQLLELHLSKVVPTSVLSLVSLSHLKHLKLTADEWHHEIGFVEGAEPPVFRLDSLVVDHFVFPPLLEFLLPALSNLTSLSVGLDECDEDDHVDAVLAMLRTCRDTLMKLVLTVIEYPVCCDFLASTLSSLRTLQSLEYYGNLCECCCDSLILSLPSAVRSLFFHAEPFDTVSAMLSETILDEEKLKSADGTPLLPALERVEIPIKSKKLLSKRELDRAKAKRVLVRGFKARRAVNSH